MQLNALLLTTKLSLKGPADETSMDLYNNAQGRFLGFAFASSGDEAAALNQCALWARIGLLSTLS